MSEMQMAEGFGGVINRLRAEGDLTRNSGANSIKRLTATVQELVNVHRASLDLSQKQAMFDRFEEKEDDKPEPAPVEATESKEGGMLKGLKNSPFFKLVKGFLGLLSVAIIPALALLLNNPKVFEGLKSAIMTFIDGIDYVLTEFGLLGKAIVALGAGLAVALVFAPFKTMGGIAKVGKFIGKKFLNLTNAFTKGLKPDTPRAPANRSPQRAARAARPTGAVRPDGSIRGRDPAPSRDRQPARGARGGQGARGGRGGGMVRAAAGLAKLGAGAGKGIGSFVGGILKGVATGLAAIANPMTLVGLAAVAAAAIAISAAIRIMTPAFEPIGKMMKSFGESVREVFGGLGDFVKDIGTTIEGIVTKLGAAIGDVIDKISKMSTAGTDATTKQIKELSAIPGEGMIAAAKGIDAMKAALEGFGGGTFSKVADSLFGGGGPIDKIVELSKKVPELMKAAEAINVLSAAGSDFALAEEELNRRKRITQLTKDIASGDVEGRDTPENIKKAKDELAELRRQSDAVTTQAQARRINDRAADGQTGGQVTINQQSNNNNVDASQKSTPAPAVDKSTNGAGTAAILQKLPAGT